MDRCRDALKDLLQLRPLVAALQAKPSTECSGIHLLQAARSAREADGFMGPPNVYEMALKRDGLLAFQNRDFHAYYVRVNVEWVGDASVGKPDRIFVGGVSPATLQPQVQDYMLVKMLADTCNAAATEEGSNMLQRFLKEVVVPLSMSPCYLVDEGLKTEFVDLLRVVDPMDFTVPLVVMTEARDRIMSNSSGCLYKAMNLRLSRTSPRP